MDTFGEPAVVVTLFVGVLAFVAGGGLNWIFPSARAWRRIEQRARILEQVDGRIANGTRDAIAEEVGKRILAQLRPETATTVSPQTRSEARFEQLMSVGRVIGLLTVLGGAIGSLLPLFALLDSSAPVLDWLTANGGLILGVITLLAALSAVASTLIRARHSQSVHADLTASWDVQNTTSDDQD